MSRAARQVQLTAGYVLHHRPYRDTSRIVEVFTRDHGRLTLFARGCRGPKSRLAPLLQPFRPLLLSFLLGRGDAAQLTQAELAVPGVAVPPPAALMSAYYLNELLMRLTGRLDAQPVLFDGYQRALQRLSTAEPTAQVLREFEWELLQGLGYGVEFRCAEPSDEPLHASHRYRFEPGAGFVRSRADDALAGSALLAMQRGEWQDSQVQIAAARVLRLALDHCLDGQDIRTRAVARAVRRQVAR
jgi:DNA repair protein RecO (recombination protein O)